MQEILPIEDALICFPHLGILETQEYKEKVKFLYGDSMGGAVCLLLQRRDPSFWDGIVLIAPMWKNFIPKWKVAAPKDIIDSAFNRAKREEIRNNKLIYQDKSRLKTAMEMFRNCMSLEDSLHEVTLPFLVLQGEEDVVTDPRMSNALYEQGSSRDKTIKLYTGMCHGITTGETDENITLVFVDIIAWLDKRTIKANVESVRQINLK